MILATLETRHFTFTAAGETVDQAIRALELGWETHRHEFPDALRTFVHDYHDDIRLNTIEPGECWRDDTLLLANGMAVRAIYGD